MRLENGRGCFAFSAPLVSLASGLAPFFAVGRGNQVGRGCDFVLGGDGGVPEADEVIPGCGEEMGAGVVGGNGRERGRMEVE